MFQYSCELNIIKHSIFYWGLSKHLVNIIISKPVSNRCKQLSQSIFMKNSNIILIKATKCILDNILWIRSLQSFSKHSEVDRTRRFIHHFLEVVISRILTKTSKHVMEVLFVNEPIPIMVNHVESFLELLNLVLVEHSKHIASSSLCPLLGSSSSSCCFSR